MGGETNTESDRRHTLAAVLAPLRTDIDSVMTLTEVAAAAVAVEDALLHPEIGEMTDRVAAIEMRGIEVTGEAGIAICSRILLETGMATGLARGMIVSP